MKKNMLILCLGLMGIVLIFSGIACRDHSHREDNNNTVSNMNPDDNPIPENIAVPGQGRHAGASRGSGRTGKSLGRNTGINLTEKEKEMVKIQTAQAEYRAVKDSLSAPAKVMAHRHRKAIVSYAFPARIAEIHVRIGDWVNAGEKLITLQSEEVGTAKSEFYKAQADFELAQVNYEREERLVERGVGAKKNFLAAEADLKVAEATLTAAEKKLHVLGFSEPQVDQIRETHQINPIITLYAPIRGKIIENNAILGQMVDQGSEILVLLDPTLLCVDADIYEKDIARVRMGQSVEVTVPAFPEEKFGGEIRFISDVLNEDTRTITVRTEVENKDLKLKAGMFANVNIRLNHQEKALVVPSPAVLEDKGENIVFLKRGDAYFLQVVQTGVTDNGFLEILKGLQEGDVVVTNGNFQLKSKLYEEILKQGQIH